MPRIAAAVAVVVTVGLSIGINIARFPAVWEMVNSPGMVSASPRASTSLASPEPGSAADLSRMAPPVPLGVPPVDTAGPIRVAEPAPIVTEEKKNKGGSSETPSQSVSAKLVSAGQPEASGSSVTAKSEPPADLPNSTAASSNTAAGGANLRTTPPLGTSGPTAMIAQSEGCLRGGAAWPADVSPTMKYAANRPLGAGPPDASQAPPAKPLVPVVWPDSSTPKATAPVVSTVSAEKKVERLPPVGKDKPIPKEDLNRTPDGPIPAYPNTGR